MDCVGKLTQNMWFRVQSHCMSSRVGQCFSSEIWFMEAIYMDIHHALCGLLLKSFAPFGASAITDLFPLFSALDFLFCFSFLLKIPNIRSQ